MGNLSTKIQEDFCRPGDSGAWRAWIIGAVEFCLAVYITGQCGPANLGAARNWILRQRQDGHLPCHRVLQSIALWATPESIP